VIRKLLLVTLPLALLTGATFGLASRGSQSTAGTPADTAPRTDWITADGKTEGAREELALRAELTGTIRKVCVRANQNVRQGDLLIELENGTHHAHVQRAEALVKRREADCDGARDNYERLRRSGSGASMANLKQAETALSAARADCDMARADLQQARAELAKTRLLAPWDGRILRVYDEPGALVGPASARPILLMADVSRRRVRAFVEELDALRVRAGQRAVVTADGLPGMEFPGRVSDEVMLRMDRGAPHSDAPGEYQDIYHRPVVIDLDDGRELPLNLRVNTRIEVASTSKP
jgi:RND family efflux transporter MFP subunit